MFEGHDLGYWLPIIVQTGTILGFVYKSFRGIIDKINQLDQRLSTQDSRIMRLEGRVDMICMVAQAKSAKPKRTKKKPGDGESNVE